MKEVKHIKLMFKKYLIYKKLLYLDTQLKTSYSQDILDLICVTQCLKVTLYF